MVNDMSSVSEETTSKMAMVSVATEEQTAAMSEVARNIRQVPESAQSLKDLVGRFDVGDADDAGGSSHGGGIAPGEASPAAPLQSMSRAVTGGSGTGPDSPPDD